MSPDRVLEQVTAAVVGRRREAEILVAALDAGRHVLLEGPPGTGKSTLLRALAGARRTGFAFVEGNAELTPARLVGHFDPARVLAEGYDPAVFVAGPLVEALRSGVLLYVEELNRVPEETLNVLVTVLSEDELTVPRLGRIVAAPGFRLVTAMNPYDAVGTARISSTVHDRLCRVAFGYQSADDERRIVARELEAADVGRDDTDDGADAVGGARGRGPDDPWLARVVEVVRRTREHPDVQVGSSVRGAIDTAVLARSLARVRHDTHDAVGLDAALTALSGRIRLRPGCDRTPEDVIAELWHAVAAPAPTGEATQGKGDAPAGAHRNDGHPSPLGTTPTS
jgi:MoxR-like ATPase